MQDVEMAEQLRISPATHKAACGVGVALINFNTHTQTLRCLESLRGQEMAPDTIVVLDNSADSEPLLQALVGFAPYRRTDLRILHSSVNTGFAGGCNRAIELLLADSSCRYVLLLNNDTVAQPKLIRLLLASAASDPAVGLAGGRMHRLADWSQVDTLGITIYASLMPADRRTLDDPYMGPTGGCCMVSRQCLDALHTTSGHWLDERFFCYCEDTDLVLRANLLGFKPTFVDEVLALHEGQASTGGGYNTFIAYHGIRNSVWMLAKSMPTRLLLKYGILLLIAHFMTIARHLASGNPRLIYRVYRDALRSLPSIMEDRRRILGSARVSSAVLDGRIAPRFYRAGYLSLVLKQLAAIYRGKTPRRN